MIDLAVLAGAAVTITSVLLVFGCICHLFKKPNTGFSTFENDAEIGQGQGFSIFTTSTRVSDSQDNTQVTFEPLPDILAKTVSATALRPRISCVDKERQKLAAKHITVYRPFPRSQLLYVKEIGIGWFGQVLLGDADKISINSKRSRIVVKLLKDDATAAEQQLFLEEMAAYREIEHPNVLQLLGQCTESAPFLVILEHSPYMDLKSYQRKHVKESESMIKRGVPVKFLTDMAAGLASLHRHGFIHHDFACRNCLVMSDLTVKVGDYGVAEDHFREDYYDTGQDLLPVRWMSPESLQYNDTIWQVTQYTTEANIWSFGVSMWEVIAFGKRPYDQLSDEEVLQKVIGERNANILLTELKSPSKQKLNEVMEYCWLEAQQRPTIETIHAFLLQVYQTYQEQETQKHVAFESKWEQASTSEPKVVIVDPKYHKKDQSGGDGSDLHDNMLTNESVIKNVKPNNGFQVTVDVHSEPLSDGTIVAEQESALKDFNKMNTKKNKYLSAVKTAQSKGSGAVTIPPGPPIKQTDATDVVVEMDNVMVVDVGSGQVNNKGHRGYNINNSNVESRSKEDPDSNVLQSKCAASDIDTTEKATDDMDDSFVILGGSEQQTENLDLSSTEILSPIPSNISSPKKGHKSAHRLTSTPFSKDSPSVYLTASSNQTSQNDSTAVFFTAENTPTNQAPDIKANTVDTKEEAASTIDSTPVKNIHVNNNKSSVSRKLAKEVGDNVLDNVLKDPSTTDKSSASESSSSEDDNVSDKSDSDNESQTDQEQLELLKMSIANALSTGAKESRAAEEEANNSGSESPTSEEYEIAREIYISKGMTIPPTTRVTQRSLHIIPEDEIPEECQAPEIHTSSPLVKESALKFVEPMEDSLFSGSAPDSFEWDDYIGDELVGNVKDSENSPRQTMEFPDWTLENDASQGSESNNHSRAGSEASDNHSRPGSRASSGLSTPFSASDSEVKSPSGMSSHSYIRDILSNRLTSTHATNRSISNKSSFYALSHTLDIDSSEHVSSDSEPSTPPGGIINGDGAYMEDWDIL